MGHSVEYKRIENFPLYYIGNNGKVLREYKKHLIQLKPVKMKIGYLAVELRNGVDIKRKYVHRLVLAAFVGPCPDGYECRHLNGVRHDNRLENLKWGTFAENQMDRVKHGTDNRGVRNSQAKLDENKVRYIRDIYSQGNKTQTELALKFGVDSSVISEIVNRKLWKHV